MRFQTPFTTFLHRRIILLLLLQASATGQDGNWSLHNQNAGPFAGWATASAAEPYVGDFNGDGQSDIALVRRGPGWNSIPVAFAQSDGPWVTTNHVAGNFPAWAAVPGVTCLTGDFNGDQRTDLALVRGSAGWASMPVAFAAPTPGGWVVTNGQAGAFANWATATGVKPIVGDFNADGRSDIALVRQTAGWASIPVALSLGNGQWTISNQPAGAFAGWATSGADPIAGDFDGDGRTDIALVRRTPGWYSIPIAFARPGGSWQITNRNVGSFGPWAATSGTSLQAADFNGDGRTDLALVRQVQGWSSMPVALASGNGYFTVSNSSAGDFAGWAAMPGAQPLVGDFNADGRSDIALIRRVQGWSTMPVAFAQANGTWHVTNGRTNQFSDWATADGVVPLVGEFNSDGRADVALVRRTSGWLSVPLALASDVPLELERHLRVSRHPTAALDNARADTILQDASDVLQDVDGPGDVACHLRFRRRSNVAMANVGDGSIDTVGELNAAFAAPGDVFVVRDINFCERWNPATIGCARAGSNLVVERLAIPWLDCEGILWAHEYGHTVGLGHRCNATNSLVMCPTIGPNRREINQFECSYFLGDVAMANASSGSTPFEIGTRPGLPEDVYEFVMRRYFEGLPLDRAADIDREYVPALIRMLADPSMVEFHENIALTLGMVGDERALVYLVAYIRAGASHSGSESLPRAAWKGRVGALVALGFMVGRSGTEEALTYLRESTSPDAWVVRGISGFEPEGSEQGQTREDLSKFAILALGVTGHPEALMHLDGLFDPTVGSESERAFRRGMEDIVTQSIDIHAEVSRLGLVGYYRKE